MVNRMSSYFPKNNMNTHKVKRHRNSDTKTGNREPQQNYRLGTVCNELLGGLNMTLLSDPLSLTMQARGDILHKNETKTERMSATDNILN